MSDKFKYKYDAPSMEERREIDSIRSQYLPKDKTMTKLERLRYLDKKVKNIPVIYSLCFGVVGILLFGVGLTFFLEWVEYFYIGIPFGLVGIILMAFAYPIYSKLLVKYKDKYGQEILDLSNELLSNNE